MRWCLIIWLLQVVIATSSNACTPTNFLNAAIDERRNNPAIASVLTAYPSLQFDEATSTLASSDDDSIVVKKSSQHATGDLLDKATFSDQFRYPYPLDFDLAARAVPWVDPGRVRNAEFMSFLYFDNKRDAEASLLNVRHQSSGTEFRVTAKHGVSCQLGAVLQKLGSDFDPFLQNVGGSFNWRKISGTERLSMHAFGAAIDLNSELGGYWKWSGFKPGAVGSFQNQFPEKLVSTFEKYGFIWGGKWHHFDGMHFEYRPELIIYARIIANGE